MARKRKSSEMHPSLPRSRSPNNPTEGTKSAIKHELDQAFKRLCEKADVQLPYDIQLSPSKSTQSKLVVIFAFLWRNFPIQLDESLDHYYESLSTDKWSTRQSRVENLYSILEPVFNRARDLHLHLTPKKNRHYDTGANQRLPDSPSPGKGLMAANSPTRSSKGNELTFGVTKLVSSNPERMLPIKPLPVPVSLKAGTSAANATTSFQSTLANTSFTTTTANTSFSEPPKWSSRDTQNTSFSEPCNRPAHKSGVIPDHLPVTPTYKCMEWTAEVEAALSSEQRKQSSSTDEPLRSRAASALKTRDSESNYGSSSWANFEFEAIPSFPESPHNVAIRDVGDHLPPIHLKDLPKRRRQGHSPIAPMKPFEPVSISIANGFASLQIPTSFSRLHFILQWEAQRVLQAGVLSASDLEARWQPRNPQALCELVTPLKTMFNKGFHPQFPLNFEDVTFSGRLQWSKSRSGPLFDLVLDCPKKEAKSCALQRRLGADRVIYLDLPDIQRSPTGRNRKAVEAALLTFTSGVQKFLDREWVTYALQPNKKKGERNMSRIVLISGSSHTSATEALQWALPFERNAHQLASKAYMRLELQLSKTIKIAELRQSEIAYKVEDLQATNDDDDRRFEDPALRDRFPVKLDTNVIMNDGCNECSYWLASEYARLSGLATVPAVLQMRVAGAKGVWYVKDNDPRKRIKRPSGILINISESQLKVQQDLASADVDWLSANVVNHNGSPRASQLYTALLPILLDRGVPHEALREEVNDHLQAEVAQVLAALRAEDTLDLRRWMQTNKGLQEEKSRETGIKTIAGFPASRDERIIRMLESGFDPKLCLCLAQDVKIMLKDHFKLDNHRISLPQSTILMGVADQYRCLKPGEVYIQFQSPFHDTITGGTLTVLDGVELLVSRAPMLGQHDVQKVVGVYKPELAHLTNVIVFPTKGKRPIADKLQGGDYDGDMYWITWSERLTKPFMNAPAPTPEELPSPEDFGITKDETKLCDCIANPTSLEDWTRWLGKKALARLGSSGSKMLGEVTLHLERLIYARGSVGAEDVRKLLPLHDHLVDADKQGYLYDGAAFRTYLKRANIPLSLPEPAYWKFTRPSGCRTKDDARKLKEKETTSYLPSVEKVTGNIIDMVYFEVMEPMIEAALKEVSEILQEAGMYDQDLPRFHDQIWNSEAETSVIRQELKALKESLQSVRTLWSGSFNSSHQCGQEALRRETRKMYDEILPQQVGSHASEWLRQLGRGFRTWDMIKASALAKHQYHGGKMIFSVAGNELCCLKLHEVESEPQYMLRRFYDASKLRSTRRKTELQAEQDENFGDDVDFDDMEFADNKQSGYY